MHGMQKKGDSFCLQLVRRKMRMTKYGYFDMPFKKERKPSSMRFSHTMQKTECLLLLTVIYLRGTSQAEMVVAAQLSNRFTDEKEIRYVRKLESQ